MTTHSFSKVIHALVIAILALSTLIVPASVAVAAPAKAPLSDATYDCTSQSEIPEAECNALVALYNSTNGIGWRNSTDWLGTNTPCSWYGITCDAGYVTQFQLSSNNLVGTIPTQLGDLTNLTILYLYDNRLSGAVPTQLGSLTNLTILDLSYNYLSGFIPTQLGNLTNLTVLYLNNNLLSGEIPSSITNLAGLINLTLGCGFTSDDSTVIAFLNEKLPGWQDNQCPVITEGTSSSVTMSRNGSPIAFSLTLHATDANAGDTLTWMISSGTFHGGVSVSDMPTGNSQEISYFPDTDYVGSDSFEVRVDDSSGGADTIIVDVNISNVPTLNIEIGWVGGYGDWLSGPYTLTVDDPETTEDPSDYTFTSDTPEFDLDESLPEPGFTVTMSNYAGTITKSIVMTDQSISVDFLNSTVSGTTDSSLPLTVRAKCGSTVYWRHITPTPGMEWTVDFLTEGGGSDEQTTVPLDYSCKIRSVQTDPEGDTSEYRWIYSSISYCDPMSDWVSVEFWPPDTYVELELQHPTDLDPTSIGSLVVGESDATNDGPYYDDMGRPWHLLYLGDFDLEVGDTVTLRAGPDSDHADYLVEYVVDNLDFTLVNLYEDTIYGVADPGDEVVVNASPGSTWDNNGSRVVIADSEDGTWSVDFSELDPDASFPEEQVVVNLVRESLIDASVNRHTEIRWPTTKSRLVDESGRTVFTDNAALEVPPLAINGDTEFNIVETGSGFQITTDQGVLDAVASATIGPEGTSFSNDATVTLEWPDADNNGIVDETTINEADLYVSKDGVVVAGPCGTEPTLYDGCDPVANTFSVEVHSLSDYVVGSQAANHEPSVNSATFIIGDNAPNGTSVGAVSYTDEDTGQTHTCSIYDGNADNAFAVDASTCEITVSDASKIDYIVKPSYSLKVRVTDNGAPARHGDVVITLNVIQCYALTLDHTGSGSDPTANPTHSTGCATGSYTASESISFSGATPDAGWQISSWTGTSNNASTASTNSLVMPASNSSVNVNYTAIPVQVVKNGGFNTYSGTSKIPKYWVKSTNFASTDGKETSIKKEGTASVRIAGAAGKTKTLTQTLSLSGVAGQPFTFSYWVKGSAMPTKGSCYGQVLFYYGTSLKGTKMLKCPTGATYSWKNVKLNLTAPATYNKVLIRFTYSKASGKVWFDLASLLR